MWVWYVLAGLLAGVISGMGIGGGAVLIPALTMLLGMGQREAQNVNLLYFIPTAVIALLAHKEKGNIEKKGIGFLIFFGIIGSVAGSFAATRLDNNWLRKGFGIFLLGMGVFEFFKKGALQQGRKQS
ncbi:MAG: sulfite exporter TauE/SafE family protein [Clostridiales bacterium]|jgi:uncharacterized membrane protein YfcA|nr:sulfite exporter TauE/SafE family protein [Clostridiales bacterium]